MEEIILFLSIRSAIRSFNWFRDHLPAAGKHADHGGLAEREKRLEILAKELKDFGVDNPFVRRGVMSYEFNSWYKWWDEYITSLSAKNKSLLESDLKKDENLEKWRPSGDWRKKVKV